MNTVILILALMSTNGGTSIEKIEFNGPGAESRCEKAAEVWRAETDTFSVTGRAFCVIK